MSLYQAILFPTDGSGGASRALHHAIELAATNEATLHILYVVDTTAAAAVPAADEESIREILGSAGRSAIADADTVAQERDISTETAVRDGPVHQAIIDYADTRNIDLIVMGTHGRTGIDRLLLGSATERVIKHAKQPVMVVRSEA